MKKILKITLIALFFVSCNQNLKNKEQLKTNQKYMNKDSIYSDIDLFTFKGFKPKGDLDTFLTMKDLDSTKIITIVTKNNSKDIIYKKNNKGYYTNINELKELYFMEYEYTIYSKNKIITFYLTKPFNSKTMELMSYRIYFPIDKENKQRELQYKFSQTINVDKFEEIEYLDIMKIVNHTGYENEFYYYFNFEDKNCKNYFLNDNKLELNNKYNIGNSKSVASPLYEWEFVR